MNLNTFRVMNIGVVGDEAGFSSLLDLFDRYPGVCDEIALFLSLGSHPPMPLPTAREMLKKLSRYIEMAKARGYGCGINVLSTIGHHSENLPNSLGGDITRMTNIDGAVCMGSFCPNDERMRDFVRGLYTLTAEANPDFIWVDDDVRFGHMPIGNGCFCDGCLKRFSEETGETYTREELKRAFENDLPLRARWLEHNRKTIVRLLSLVEETVHAVRPNMKLGIMTGERYFEGASLDQWADALHGNGGTEVMFRPGGGAYEDVVPRDLPQKSHQVGRQNALMPLYVRQIQSEIETFPGACLRKGKMSIVREAAMHIAAGCTGTAYNALPPEGDGLDAFEPFLSEMARARPFHELLAKTLGRAPSIGLHTGWNRDSQLAAGVGREWTTAGPFDFVEKHAVELTELGIPCAYGFEDARCYALAGNAPLSFKPEEIVTMLSRGVYMDAEALDCLNKLGYGELTGFATTAYHDVDCIECFGAHPLNPAGCEGRIRNCRQAFHPRTAAGVRPTMPGTETLTSLVDYAGDEVERIGMGVYENKLGGRVCVAAYYPWHMLGLKTKSEQIKRVMRWLTKGEMPVMVDSYARVTTWARRLPDGRIGCVLLNQSFDTLDELTIDVKTDAPYAECYDWHCARRLSYAETRPDGRLSFKLPRLEPWDMTLVVI